MDICNFYVANLRHLMKMEIYLRILLLPIPDVDIVLHRNETLEGYLQIHI
jgi:methyl coenzyme M reductase subunit C-like uncharacterized protein (methanogenesis marker protein 7)